MGLCSLSDDFLYNKQKEPVKGLDPVNSSVMELPVILYECDYAINCRSDDRIMIRRIIVYRKGEY